MPRTHNYALPSERSERLPEGNVLRSDRASQLLRTTAILFGFLVGLSVTGAAAAGEARGWFGISLNVDAGGFSLSPTVTRATVLEVAPNSPAAAGGIRPGDEVLEVGGLAVAGGKAKELKAVMAKAVGESLTLQLKRQNGETYTTVLIAARKPGT